MPDRPIIFSGEMIRALLDGRKTMDRRVLKPQPPAGHELVGIYAPGLTAVFNPAGSEHYGNPDQDFSVALPFRLRQRLWCRETWMWNGAPNREYRERQPCFYRATEPEMGESSCDPETGDMIIPVNRWRPSIHMPRWASRLTLIVTDVRVERLSEISEEDAEAEGVFRHIAPHSIDKIHRDQRGETAIAYFRDLWNSLHKPGSQWQDDPWVCVVRFETHKANIDAMKEAA